MTSYAVVIERASDGGYGAWCPDLPGCVAVADTEDAVLAEMRRAIELHLAPGSAKTASQSHILQLWRQLSSLSTQPDARAHSDRLPPLHQRAEFSDRDGLPGWLHTAGTYKVASGKSAPCPVSLGGSRSSSVRLGRRVPTTDPLFAS